MISNLYLHSDAPRSLLRIGVLLDSEVCPRCFSAVLEDLRRADFVRLELLVFRREPPQRALVAGPTSPLSALLRRLKNRNLRGRLLYDLYARLDGHNQPADDPLTEVDCSELLKGVERIEVDPIVKGFTHRFPPEAVERVRAHDLDVILRFGFNILRGDILKVARCGIWSFHHGDNEHYRGGPPHFWEIYEGTSLSGVILQILTEELDAGLVLCKSLFATQPGLSTAKNRYGPYWGTTHFVIRKLQELHQDGWEHLQRRAQPALPYKGKRNIYRRPGNWEMARWLIPRLAKQLITRPFRRPAVSHWRIALRHGARPLYHMHETPDLHGFKWLESPRGHSYADPFLLARGGQTWLFFEDFRYSESRGRICCAELQPNGSLGPVRPCLERAYHLSYPHVFEHDGEVFMIPESGANSTVELYRAIRFPDEWVLEKVLFEGRAVDTTAWHQNDLWWFFTTLAETPGHSVMQLLFYSHSLTGDWKYHPANPISTDVRRARGAGAIFGHAGRLVRPTQDCSRNYGYSFTFNEIINLSPTTYEERAGQTVDPSWHPRLRGTHTYGQCGSWEAVDGSIRSPRRHHV